MRKIASNSEMECLPNFRKIRGMKIPIQMTMKRKEYLILLRRFHVRKERFSIDIPNPPIHDIQAGFQMGGQGDK